MPPAPGIVGYLFARLGPQTAELMVIGIARENQGCGYGRTLLQEFLAHLPVQTEVFLEVSAQNTPAISLYKSFGFETFNVRKKYYPDRTDALCMKLDLAKPQ